MEAWFKVNYQSDAAGVIIGCSNGGVDNASINVSTSSVVSFTPGGSSLSYGPVSNNTWHHVAGVADNKLGEIRLYVDGTRVSTTKTSWAFSCTELVIGSNHGRTRDFNGSIDSVTVWNRSLSAAEITQHYTEGIQLQSKQRAIFESRQMDFASGVAGITYYNATEWKYDMNWTREPGNLTLGGGYGDYTVLYMKFDRNCTDIKNG